MTDEEIVSKITAQLYVALALQVTALLTERFNPANATRIEHLHKTARLFTAHALRLLATHRLAAARWMDARLAEPKWVTSLQ